MAKIKTIRIDDIEYVRADSVKEMAEKHDGLDYVLIRTYSAGCFTGYLKSREGKEVTLLKARRLWYWDGASSLSQLAVDGVKNPSNCKFPVEVPEITLTEATEVILVSSNAKKSIDEVKVWKQ